MFIIIVHFTLIKVFSPGGPPALSSTQRKKSAAAARKTVSSVTSRHAASFGKRTLSDMLADPDEDDDLSDSGNELQLWKLLPQLKELPEAFVKKLLLSAMFQLNTALAKERKCAEKLGVNTRLAHNAKML